MDPIVLVLVISWISFRFPHSAFRISSSFIIPFYILDGMNNVMTGKAIRSTMCSTSATTNGTTPRNMVPTGISATPERMKTFIPTGGVIRPISITRTFSVPGCNPAA